MTSNECGVPSGESIARVACGLGFEYPQHLSRVTSGNPSD